MSQSRSGWLNIGKTIGQAAISMAKEPADKARVALTDKNLAW
jgi:hypothetical protein